MIAACRIAPVSFVPGLCITDRSRDTREEHVVPPDEGHNTAEFTMLPQGDATSVGWRMHGPLPFMGKVMHLFMNMDNMIGKDFESGLASLKRLAEK
jgi:hypothetical protein